MNITEKITDEKLYELCKLYGERARFWRQKFIGLLPEVNRRRLFEKKGFQTILEFAAKLAGVGEKQLDMVLNLEKRFQDKPDLHKALVNGEVSVNKLARVVSISTPENQSFLAEQVKILPQKALETFVRDEKSLRAQELGEQLPVLQLGDLDTISESELGLSQEVKEKLHELKNKGIDINQLILMAIQKREQEIAEEKEKIAFEQISEETSRYISRKIEKLIDTEFGDKCAVPNCQKKSEQIHHTLPFAMLKNHNPYFLKPLCKEHHAIAHGINLAYSRHARHF
ncbi:MAG: hypothetical protein AAB739_04810 [Patescibacteria group bacterium]